MHPCLPSTIREWSRFQLGFLDGHYSATGDSSLALTRAGSHRISKASFPSSTMRRSRYIALRRLLGSRLSSTGARLFWPPRAVRHSPEPRADVDFIAATTSGPTATLERSHSFRSDAPWGEDRQFRIGFCANVMKPIAWSSSYSPKSETPAHGLRSHPTNSGNLLILPGVVPAETSQPDSPRSQFSRSYLRCQHRQERPDLE